MFTLIIAHIYKCLVVIKTFFFNNTFFFFKRNAKMQYYTFVTSRTKEMNLYFKSILIKWKFYKIIHI